MSVVGQTKQSLQPIVMIAGLVANLVAVISIGAAGLIWVGRIDERVLAVTSQVAKIEAREDAKRARIDAVEMNVARMDERIKQIYDNVIEMKDMIRRTNTRDAR